MLSPLLDCNGQLCVYESVIQRLEKKRKAIRRYYQSEANKY